MTFGEGEAAYHDHFHQQHREPEHGDLGQDQNQHDSFFDPSRFQAAVGQFGDESHHNTAFSTHNEEEGFAFAEPSAAGDGFGFGFGFGANPDRIDVASLDTPWEGSEYHLHPPSSSSSYPASASPFDETPQDETPQAPTGFDESLPDDLSSPIGVSGWTTPAGLPNFADFSTDADKDEDDLGW